MHVGPPYFGFNATKAELLYKIYKADMVCR